MQIATCKKQILIRIPRELDERLEKHVKKIGISKQAFVLGLIYKELKKEAATEIYINDAPTKTAEAETT